MPGQRIKFGLLLGCMLVATVQAKAGFLAEDLAALEPLDSTICGFDVLEARLADITAQLGEPLDKPEQMERTTYYHWQKGPLFIEVGLSRQSGAVKSVLLRGDDKMGLCQTGRGIRLGGSTWPEVQQQYGHFVDEQHSKKGAVDVVAEWSTNENYYMRLLFAPNQRLSRIEVTYLRD